MKYIKIADTAALRWSNCVGVKASSTMSAAHLPLSIIPKENKKAILKSLFEEGVFVVKKDVKVGDHHYLAMPNIHAMMTLKTLLSKKYVKETFAWRFNYYTLTDEGVQYLRDFLHLSASDVPKCHIPVADRAPRREGAPRTGGFRRGPRPGPKAEGEEKKL